MACHRLLEQMLRNLGATTADLGPAHGPGDAATPLGRAKTVWARVRQSLRTVPPEQVPATTKEGWFLLARLTAYLCGVPWDHAAGNIRRDGPLAFLGLLLLGQAEHLHCPYCGAFTKDTAGSWLCVNPGCPGPAAAQTEADRAALAAWVAQVHALGQGRPVTTPEMAAALAGLRALQERLPPWPAQAAAASAPAALPPPAQVVVGDIAYLVSWRDQTHALVGPAHVRGFQPYVTTPAGCNCVVFQTSGGAPCNHMRAAQVEAGRYGGEVAAAWAQMGAGRGTEAGPPVPPSIRPPQGEWESTVQDEGFDYFTYTVAFASAASALVQPSFATDLPPYRVTPQDCSCTLQPDGQPCRHQRAAQQVARQIGGAVAALWQRLTPRLAAHHPPPPVVASGAVTDLPPAGEVAVSDYEDDFTYHVAWLEPDVALVQPTIGWDMTPYRTTPTDCTCPLFSGREPCRHQHAAQKMALAHGGANAELWREISGGRPAAGGSRRRRSGSPTGEPAAPRMITRSGGRTRPAASRAWWEEDGWGSWSPQEVREPGPGGTTLVKPTSDWSGHVIVAVGEAVKGLDTVAWDRRHGTMVVPMPPAPTRPSGPAPAEGLPAALAPALPQVAGIFLPGGGDVHPAAYGEKPRPQLGKTNPARDALELALARQALASGKPLLGICRGLQVTAVAAGGTLYQDLPTQYPAHQPLLAHRGGYHQVTVAADSHLATIVGATTLRVNSYHHQAIREVPPGWRAVAWAEDGVIEAIEPEDPSRPWVCVQWHPEMMYHDRSASRLLDWFAAQVEAGPAWAPLPPAAE